MVKNAEGKELISLVSPDYLGLHNTEKIKARLGLCNLVF